VSIPGTVTTDPAFALLLACVDSDGARARDCVAALSVGPVEGWEHLQALAARHGLGPQLWRQLQSSPELVPRDFYAQVWSTQQRLARRNRELASELREVLMILNSAGIQALPYKGPMLALQLHGDVAMREFADLDLLLRPKDIIAAKACLQSAGFRVDVELGAAAEAAMLRAPNYYHRVLVRAAPNCYVHPHWNPDPDFVCGPLLP